MPSDTFIGEKWKMPYSAAQLQNVVTHQVPIVGQNGNWWTWDISAGIIGEGAYVDTGTAADTAAYAIEAESWAVGGTNTREGEDTDNAKYYKEQAATKAAAASGSAFQASRSASTASDKAMLAKSWAVGDTGERVDEDTDNSKYYSQSAGQSATAAANSASSASGSASTASGAATTATSKATLSESWAVGGTNTRTGEDTNNAKYWAEQASHAAGGGVYSFNNRAGYVLPQSGDYSVAMVKGALPIYGKGRNLLDNAYFGNADSIIDQRGGYVLTDTATYYTDTALSENPVTVSAYTTVYYPDVHTNYVGFYLTNDPTGTKYYASRTDCVRGYFAIGYSIDRWRVSSVSNLVVEIKSDHILLTATASNTGSSLLQYIEKPADLWGKLVTLAVLTDTGVYTVSGTLPSTAPSQDTNLMLVDIGNSTFLLIMRYVASTGMFFFSIARRGSESSGKTLKVYGVDLELGDTQTAFTNLGTEQSPNWVPSSIPDYGEELAKCQRYQFKTSPYQRHRACLVSGGALQFFIPTPVTLRAFPSSASLSGVEIETVPYTSSLPTGFTFSASDLAGNGFFINASKANHGLTDGALRMNGILIDANL